MIDNLTTPHFKELIQNQTPEQVQMFYRFLLEHKQQYICSILRCLYKLTSRTCLYYHQLWFAFHSWEFMWRK